jgi:translocation and assembly module TamB
MSLALLPLDPAFSIDADLRGLASVAWDPEGLDRIDARVLMDRGDLTLLGVEDTLLTIDGIDIGIQSPEPRTAVATLTLGIEGQSEITGEVRIPRLHRPAEATIDGRIALALPRLAAFNRLVPQLDALEGRLDAELLVQGPLATPDFEGSASLSGGRIRHAPLGMHLEAIELELSGNDQGGRLTGDFVAGEGRGRIQGELRSASDGWRGEIDIDGQELALFNADWLTLQMTPALVAKFDPNRLQLDGTLTIGRARLGLPPGTAERVQPSPDVVVVGAETRDEDEAPPRAPRPIEGQVRLQLGDDVRLEAAGMRTRLTGGLDMRWQGEQAIPVANGQINLVDGAYRAYGQNLDVQRGEVSFTGNPIDNPVLDIAAAREIFGDPVVEFAGVQIRGPAQSPEIELYTLPPTSREKALAYVLTGAEFDHAAGQGAFNVGFFVLPEIFVSYGVGLFDTGNVLAARWDFAERWGLKATSGESDTGADLSFIIDR